MKTYLCFCGVTVQAFPRLPAPAPGPSSPFRTPWWAALNTTSLLAAAVPPTLPGSHLISSNKTTQKCVRLKPRLWLNGDWLVLGSSSPIMNKEHTAHLLGKVEHCQHCFITASTPCLLHVASHHRTANAAPASEAGCHLFSMHRSWFPVPRGSWDGSRARNTRTDPRAELDRTHMPGCVSSTALPYHFQSVG